VKRPRRGALIGYGFISVPSEWMDTSHKRWFSSLLDQFGDAIERRDCVSHHTLDAVESVRVISVGYASAARGGREVHLTTRPAVPRSQGGPPTVGAFRQSAVFRP
jgi:hypothetical protein